MKSLMKSLFLLVLAGAAQGEVQKRVYAASANLGGYATDQNGPVRGQHHGQHHVMLFSYPRSNNIEGFCGGSLIHAEWVITAAHCHTRGWYFRAYLNAHPNIMNREHRRVVERHTYGYFIRKHDLMLLRLENVQRGQIYPIQLPPYPCTVVPALGNQVRFYGWRDALLNSSDTIAGGQQRMISIEAHGLRFAEANVTPCGKFKLLQKIFSKYHHGHHICVFQHGVDVNSGDSGGSLVWRPPNVQQDVLYGVLSLGCDYVNQCAPFFMNICNKDYRKWINDQTGL